MGNTLGRHEVGTNAVAAYNNFLRNYCELHTEMLPNEAIENASRMWFFFTPEQRMQYVPMDPPSQKPSQRLMPVMSECMMEGVGLLPPVAVKKKVAQKNPPKPKLKVKSAANKRRIVIKAIPPKPMKVRKIVAGKPKAPNRRAPNRRAPNRRAPKAKPPKGRVKLAAINKRIKVKALASQEPAKKAFQEFLKELRKTHGEIPKRDILKRAAQAWCNMGERERRKFFK